MRFHNIDQTFSYDLGFPQTRRGPFASPRDSLEKSKLVFRSFQVAWFDSWLWLHYVEDEDNVICHTYTRAHITHQLATLMLGYDVEGSRTDNLFICKIK